ncbi:hypothetical protein [Luteibacter sp. E-22]|uniref:hypothetical protein n=1 Tax=Luteibacter sp. E-22 TaxID=3404050 RepID=UPI003CF4BB09
MKKFDLSEAEVSALSAAKASSRWAYQHNYAIGVRTISVREPNAHTVHLTSVHSWDYAKHTGCSLPVALAHLRKLVAAGFLTEERRYSTACRFRLPKEDAEQIGREIIAELRAEGLPFEDEWRAERALTKEAA